MGICCDKKYDNNEIGKIDHTNVLENRNSCSRRRNRIPEQSTERKKSDDAETTRTQLVPVPNTEHITDEGSTRRPFIKRRMKNVARRSLPTAERGDDRTLATTENQVFRNNRLVSIA
jgi:hypothetical protein